MKRIFYNLRWEAERPIHIGSGEEGIAADKTVAISGGRPYLPGSSMAGVLRDRARSLLAGRSNHRAFEFLFGSDKEGDIKASRLWVFDGRALEKVSTSIRDGVGIARATMTAQEKHLYSFEIVPIGARFVQELWLDILDGDKEASDALALLDAVLEDIKGTGLSVGAMSTSGLGQLKLDSKQALECDFKKKSHLLAFLKCESPEVFDALANAKCEAPKIPDFPSLQPTSHDVRLEPNEFTVTIKLKLEDPILPGSRRWGVDILSRELQQRILKNRNSLPDGFESFFGTTRANRNSWEVTERSLDLYPLMTPRSSGGWYFTLSGKTIRGCLRSHAERILKTLHPDCVVGPFTDDAYKSTFEDIYKKGSDDAWKEVYERSALDERMFGSSYMRSRLSVTEAYGERLTCKLFDHVRINRFTGGVHGNAKFDTYALHPGGEISFDITLTRFEMWQVGLLAFILRDLCEGLIRFGHGTRKGFGKVTGKIVKARARILSTSSLLQPMKVGDSEKNPWEWVSDNIDRFGFKSAELNFEDGVGDLRNLEPKMRATFDCGLAALKLSIESYAADKKEVREEIDSGQH